MACFAKAVTLIAAPGEVLFALEKSLPPHLFERLLQEIQSDIQAKVRGYFDSILPKGAPVAIREEIGVDPEFNEMRASFVPYAKQDIPLGATLWEELPDISALTVESFEKLGDCCEHCFTPLQEEEGVTTVECPDCHQHLYCSDICREKSRDIFHRYLCGGSKDIRQAYEELIALCHQNKSSLALLLLRYLSLLLTEEMRGNGSANNGPFNHYDHLRPVMKSPTEVERMEVKLLKRILSSSNASMAQCNLLH